MSSYKIVFTDYYYPDNNEEINILKRLGDIEIVDCTKLYSGGVKDEIKVIEYTKDADAIICQFANINKQVIKNLEKCRIISRYAIGVDNIEVEEAKKRGIVVSNVPDYCIEEVSDTTIAHILNCVRKISITNNLFQNGKWSYERIKPLFRFSEQTLGLIAFGNIARRVAEKMKNFNIRILSHDPYYEDIEKKYGYVDFVSLEELLKQSDIISVHAPLNRKTYHLIDKDKIDLLKNNVIIINTSRGGLIDEKAIEYGLRKKKIALAGLDVLEFKDNEYSQSILTKYPEQVVITPHIAWYSEKSVADLQRKAALNVFHMLKDGKPLYSV